MNRFIRHLTTLLISGINIIPIQSANAGCTNTSQWGSATIDAMGGVVTISTNVYAGEYSIISGAVSGQTLRFTMSNIVGTYITIHSGTYNGPVVAQGVSPLTFTNTYTGTLYAHWNTNSSCGTIIAEHTTTVQCTSCQPPPPPANDNCVNATVITPVAGITCTASISGTTKNATWDGPAQSNNCYSVQSRNVWYSFTASGIDKYNITTKGTTGYLVMELFSGNCGAMVSIGCNYIWGSATQVIETDILPAGIYHYRVSDYYSNTYYSAPFTTCVSYLPSQPCTSTVNGLYPSHRFTSTCLGIFENVTTMGKAGEYSLVNVTAGTTYTFMSSVSSDLITIYGDASQKNPVYAYGFSGTEGLTWTATISGVVRFATHLPFCNSSSVVRVRSVKCMPPEGPPVNDLCSSVIPVTLTSGVPQTFSGTTAGATITNDFSFQYVYSPYVWHAFSITSCSDVVITYCGNAPERFKDGIEFGLYKSCPGNNSYAAPVSYNTTSCNDGNYTLSFSELPAGTYYLPVIGSASGFNYPGLYSINVTATNCVPPVDPCTMITNIEACGIVNSTTIGVGSGLYNFSTTCSSNSRPGKEKIYSFTPAVSGLYQISQTSDISQYIHYFFKPVSGGCSATGWTCIGSYYGSYPSNSGSFNLTAGTEYYIMLDPEVTIAGGDVSFSIQCPPAPYDPCSSILTAAPSGSTQTLFFSPGDGTFNSSSCYGASTPAKEQIYSFTPTQSGNYQITQPNTSTYSNLGYIFYSYKPASEGCNSSGWICIDAMYGMNAGNNLINFELTAGIEYYIMVDAQGTGGYDNITWGLLGPIPPVPPNDLCTSVSPVTIFPGIPQVFEGFTKGGTPDGYLSGSVVFHEITTTSCSKLIIDYSGTYKANYEYANIEFQFLSTQCPLSTNMWDESYIPASGVQFPNGNNSITGTLLTFNNLPAGTYWIPIWNTVDTRYKITVTAVSCPADECADAIPIIPASTCSNTQGYIDGSVTQSLPPTICANQISSTAKDIWYTFNADGIKTYTVSMYGKEGFNGVIELFSGTCGSLVSLGCSRFASDPNLGEKKIDAGILPAGTYYYRIYGWNGTTGSFLTCVKTSMPPWNDKCSSVSAITLTPGVPQLFTGTTIDANPDGPLNQATVFHKIVTTNCSNLTLSFCGSVPIYSAVLTTQCPLSSDYYDGTYLFPTLSETTSCEDGNMTFLYNSLPAGTYWIAIQGRGQYTLNVIASPCIAPCESAIVVQCGSTTFGTTVGASASNRPPDCSVVVDNSPGVWYQVISPESGDMTVSLVGSSYKTKLFVYTGCPFLSCVASNHVFYYWQSQVTFQATAGVTYYIYVTGYNGESGSFVMNIRCPGDQTFYSVCPDDQILYLDGTCSATLPDYRSLATISDNSPGTESIIVTQSPAANTLISGTGSMIVTLTATDAAGNSTTCNFTVNKVDITAPLVSCPTAQTINSNRNCTATVPNYTALATTSDNCSAVTVTQSPAAGSPINGVGSFLVTLTATDASNNSNTCSFTVTVNYPVTPELTISASDVANNFCNGVLLTANSNVPVQSYTWSNGVTTQSNFLTTASLSGMYTVNVTSAAGCPEVPSANYSFNKQSLASSYTLLATNSIKLQWYNTVVNGSVGLVNANGTVSIKKNTSIAGPGAFLKAKNISLQSPYNIPSIVYEAASVSLPNMKYNTVNTGGLPNATVPNSTIITINGNRKNVTIGANCNVILTGNIFGAISIGSGSTLLFTQSEIDVSGITMFAGTNTSNTQLKFSNAAVVRCAGDIVVNTRCTINPENNKVIMYIGKPGNVQTNFTVSAGGNETINASLYIPIGKLSVGGHTTNMTYMNGKFIAENIETLDKNVIWNWYDCTPAAPAPLITSKTNGANSEQAGKTVNGFIVKAWPNPTEQQFTLNVESNRNEAIQVKVYDMYGRVVYSATGPANRLYQFGNNFVSGAYIAEVRQGASRSIVKIVKQ